MKKSLIALAVVSTFAAQAAMAEVTIYGQANVSFDAINNGAVVNSASANNVASNVSRLGFKGSEDLGDGLSAIWQVEQAIAMDTAALGASTVRDTFAGLSSGSMGTLIAGVHDTPYKMATRGFDQFGDTIADNRSIMGGAALHDARLGNVVAYIAPAFSGLTLAIATATGAEVPQANNVKGNAWSLAALYGAGPINVNFGYQTITLGTAGSGTLAAGTQNAAGSGLMGLGAAASTAAFVNAKTNAWKLGGSYDFGQGSVNAVYEKLTFTPNGGSDALNEGNWYLSGKFNINANDAIKAAYTSAGKNNNLTTAQVANTGAHQFTVGYDHSLSKRTTVYALYSKLSNDALANYTFSQSTSAANANGGVGSAPSVFSLGMKHSF